MNKIITKIGCILYVLSFVLINPMEVQASVIDDARQEVLSYYGEDYYIESLDVKIDVDESNVFKVEEDIVYNFVSPHHGPVRVFYEDHTRLREDGSTDAIVARVKDFSVRSSDAADDIADTSTDYYGDISTKTYMIGDEDKTYTGLHTYHISYRFKIYSKDPLQDADELYYNIVGDGWECPIMQTTWTINMPKEFDANTLGYSVGSYGNAGYNTDFLINKIDGTMVTGKWLLPLYPGEAVTVRTTLPEGYFVYKTHDTIAYILFAILAVVCAAFALIPPGKKPVPVVEFYAPDGISPVEAETVYKGGTPNNIMAMMPYLANKGYFDIIEGERKKFTFKLNNSKYADLKIEERTFLDGMFDGVSEGDIVKEKDLKNKKFYLTVEAIQSMFTSEAQKMFKSKSIMFMILGMLLSAVLVPVVTMIYQSLVLRMPIGEIILLLIGAVFIPGGAVFAKLANSKGFYVVSVIFTLIVGFASGSMMDNLVVGFVAAVISFCIAVSANSKLARTDSNLMLLGRVIGFREFIKTAEADRLKMLVEENPNYFYDTLAYAYAFGLEDKWVNQFERLGIGVPEPTWYTGPYIYNMNDFSRSMDKMISHGENSYGKAPSSSSSSSSGGGFSGGGFSGGGSGGGGGGAW